MALPVSALSVSSIRKLRKCPEQFRRHYIERERETASGAMMAGSAAGAAANATDHRYIETGEFMPAADVLDLFSDEWEHRSEEEEIDWRKDKPEKVKDCTAKAVGNYLDLLEKLPKPIAVEREARLNYQGVEFVAYLDREQEDGTIADRKVSGKKPTKGAADDDLQATLYLATRQVEGEDESLEQEPPTGFQFHRLIRQVESQPVLIDPTTRTDAQLDDALATILGAAQEVEWRTETGNWSYAPDGAWWCSRSSCGFWDRCAGGGALR